MRQQSKDVLAYAVIIISLAALIWLAMIACPGCASPGQHSEQSGTNNQQTTQQGGIVTDAKGSRWSLINIRLEDVGTWGVMGVMLYQHFRSARDRRKIKQAFQMGRKE